MDGDVPSGVYVVQRLLSDFSFYVSQKLDNLLKESNLTEKQLMKSLQRGEDAQFDQLLCAMGLVAEHCLSSLVDVLFTWLEHQLPEESGPKTPLSSSKSKSSDASSKEDALKKSSQEMAIKIVFALSMIEVLQQLPVHPLSENSIQRILNLSFKHFHQVAALSNNHESVNSVNNKARIVADLFSEVIGVIAKTKFQSVRRKFLIELDEARKQDHCNQLVLGLIMGMKFFRVKMYPVEDFEASFRFLRELADYFLEVKDREIKHGFAALFVEILIPVAAAVKTEVNVPVLREFVDTLYPTSLELSKRRKNLMAMYPLVTCLLCVSQKQFFLNNWHIFLEYCLSNLKHKDQKVSRVALESLYRLLWTYTVRIKCESNAATQNRLQSIIKCLFPLGSRAVVPKDTPISIYVKIIQFIAQERLDFAMKEIIMDLLGINLSSSRSIRSLNLQPERMNIGLRAFLVITDSRQQKDGAPPMPSTIGTMPSGNTLRVKKTFLNKMLTEDDARTIGVLQFHKPVQKSLDWMLLTLDTQVGQRMMMTQRTSDVIGEDNKPKIELFRTCVAAMPRLIPHGELSHNGLFELLSHLTIHIDEELRSLAFTSLQKFAHDFPAKREDVIASFLSFILKQVNDTHPVLLDTALKHLVQLISGWRNKATLEVTSYSTVRSATSNDSHEKRSCYASIINRLEGFGLVLFCSNRSVTRKLACILFKEVKLLSRYLEYTKADDLLCIDALDQLCPDIVRQVLDDPQLANSIKRDDHERIRLVASQRDVTALVELSSSWNQTTVNLWSHFIVAFMKPQSLPELCPNAVDFAWGDVHIRLNQLWHHMDLGQIAGSKKVSTIPTAMEQTLLLWTNYLVFACSCAPTNLTLLRKKTSVAIPAGTPDWYVQMLKDGERQSFTTSSMFEKLVTHLRSDNSALRDALIQGLGSTSTCAIHDLITVLEPLMKESYKLPRQENIRRKRKRDSLRLMIARLLEQLAKQKVLSETVQSSMLSDERASSETHTKDVLIKYISNTIAYLESLDKTEPSAQTLNQSYASSPQSPASFPGTFSSASLAQITAAIGPIADDMRKFFASMVTHLLKYFSPECRSTFLSHESRRSLFFMFGKWCEKFFPTGGALERTDPTVPLFSDAGAQLHIIMLKAECAVLCCGPIFDRKALNEEAGYLYQWLEGLLDCLVPSIHEVGKEAVMLLLEHNKECPSLLAWVIDKCYTGSTLVFSGCFLSICAAFNHVYAPRYLVTLLSLAIYGMGNACLVEASQHLLLLLQYRLADENVSGSGDKPQEKKIGSQHYFSQFDASKLIASCYPSLSVAVLSEIFQRFLKSTPTSQRYMLRYVIPWLQNIRLQLDTTPSGGEEGRKRNALSVTSLFVLCNLSYLTARYHTIYEIELEGCWKVLSSTNHQNLTCILLFITGLLGSHFADHIADTAKILLVYCAKSMEQKVTEYLLEECQVFEVSSHRFTVQGDFPYFAMESHSNSEMLQNQTQHWRLTSPVPPRSPASPQEGKKPSHHRSLQHINVTKTQSRDTGSLRHSSAVSLPESFHRRGSPGRDKLKKVSTSLMSLPRSIKEEAMSGDFSPKAGPGGLEMPEMSDSQSMGSFNKDLTTIEEGSQRKFTENLESLFFLPLQEFLEGDEIKIGSKMLRSNISCILLYEIAVKLGLNKLDLKRCLPSLLLAIIFGMDNAQIVEVQTKCEHLLAHIIVKLLLPSEQELIFKDMISFSGPGLTSVLPQKEIKLVTPDENAKRLDKTESISREDTKAFVLNLFTKTKLPLWVCEDISPAKILSGASLNSSENMSKFVCDLVQIFSMLIPDLSLHQLLSKQAIHVTIHANHRHYRCRCLQIFRALKVPLEQKDFCFLVQILAESIHGGSDVELQSLMIEILLTFLQSCQLPAPDSKEENKRPSVLPAPVLSPTPEVPRASNRFPNSAEVKPQAAPSNPKAHRTHSHKRSGSVTLKSKFIEDLAAPGDSLAPSAPTVTTSPSSSYGPQSNGLKKQKRQHQDETKQMVHGGHSHNCLTQIFWIGVGILESDFEFEYLLGLQIVVRVLSQMSLLGLDWFAKAERYLKNFQWRTFSGLQCLLIKGLTSVATFDLAFCAISHLTTVTHLPMVSTRPGIGNAFALNVILLLPYLVSNFSNPDKASCECAQNIAQVCVVDFKDFLKLQSLAHVMSLYVNSTYNKTMQTWISVVCKYVHETFPNALEAQIRFLTEMLDRGQSHHLACLQIMLSLLMLCEMLSKQSTPDYVQDALNVVSKHLDGKNWKEALNILKLAVARSSQLQIPKMFVSNSTKDSDKEFVGLPGLTLSFKYDISNFHMIGKKNEAARVTQAPSYSTSCWLAPNPTNRSTERLQPLLRICTFFHQTCASKTQLPIPVQTVNDVTEEAKGEEPTAMEEATSGPPKSHATSLSEDINCPGVLSNFDFLNDLESEGDGNDNFNVGIQWSTSPTNQATAKDGNTVEEQPEEFDLTAILTPEEERSDESDGSSMDRDENRNNNHMEVDPHPESDPSDAEEQGVEKMEEEQLPHQQEESLRIKSLTPISCNLSETSSHDDLTSSDLTPSSDSYYIRSTSPSPPGTSRGIESVCASGNHRRNPSTSKSSLYARVIKQNSGEEFLCLPVQQETRWNGLIDAMEFDKDGSSLTQLFVVFPSLYRLLCLSFTSISKKGCSVLGAKLSAISSHFNSMLDDLPEQLLCPLCLTTPPALLLLKREVVLGFSDLQEHVKFFYSKQQDVFSTFLTITSTTNGLIESSHETKLEQKQLELCQQLYRLHFELLVLYQQFNKLVTLVASEDMQSHVWASDLHSIHRKMSSYESKDFPTLCSSFSSEEQEQLRASISSLTPSDAEQILVKLVKGNEIKKAFKYLKCFRSMWQTNDLGLHDDGYSTTLTNLCFVDSVKSRQNEQSKDFQVIIGSKGAAQSISVKLMEVNSQIQQSLQHLYN